MNSYAYDYTIYYGLTMLAILITFGAQLYIKAVYSKYSQIPNRSGLTGVRTANEIMVRNGLDPIIRESGAYLTDHYDPRDKSVTLSSDNYEKASIASLAIAAHECGHALQDRDSYAFLKVRATLLPVANFASFAGYMAIMMGVLFDMINIVWLGIMMECIILLFQLVTLPIEFDASSRGLVQIQENGLADAEETEGAKKVLTAAALTYVAGVASTVLQILRLVLVYGRRGNRRDY